MKLLSDFATNMYLIKDATARDAIKDWHWSGDELADDALGTELAVKNWYNKYAIGHDDPSVKIRYSKARFA
jgi:hypothetical protein